MSSVFYIFFYVNIWLAHETAKATSLDLYRSKNNSLISSLKPKKQPRHCKAVIFRVQSSRWTRNFIVLQVDLWRFIALSLDCTAQTAFAMTMFFTVPYDNKDVLFRYKFNKELKLCNMVYPYSHIYFSRFNSPAKFPLAFFLYM